MKVDEMLEDTERVARSKGISIDPKAALKKRVWNAFLIGTPLAGTLYSPFYFISHPPSWVETTSFLFFYLLTGMGIGLGFHRCFTHHSFRPIAPLKFSLLFAGSLAFQGSVIRWVADHRRHHRFTDTNWDTHSPYVYGETPISNKWVGLFHAHVGWMFDRTTTSYEVYAPDLLRDSMALAFHRHYLSLTFLSLLLPYSYGWLLGGQEAALGSLLLGGCVRATLFHNVVWGVNSMGHSHGTQEASEHDESRNNTFLALMTFGEGWHNNHHAAPRSAYNRWMWHQFDLNGAIIRLLGHLGWVDRIIVPKELRNDDRREDAISVAQLEKAAAPTPGQGE